MLLNNTDLENICEALAPDGIPLCQEHPSDGGFLFIRCGPRFED